MSDPQVLLVTPHSGFEARLRVAYGPALNGSLRHWNVDGDHVRYDVLARQLRDPAPDVVVLGPDLDVETMLDLARQLEGDRPEIQVVVVASPTPTLWQAALQSGVHDIVAVDATADQLRSVLTRSVEVGARRRKNLVDDRETGDARRVVTVISPKGGSGKTTIATNLAVAMAANAPDEVVLVDLDVQFGDVAALLGLSAEHTLADVHAAVRRTDGLLLKSLLAAHDSGLWVLCSPRVPADAEDIPAERLRELVAGLSQEFRCVVIDTGAGLVDHTITAIEASTDLVLVCSSDVLSVSGLRKAIDAMDALNLVHAKRHLIVNRADKRLGIRDSDIATTLGLPVVTSVPNDRTVAIATNLGMPVVSAHPRLTASRRIQQLASSFVGSQPRSVRRRRQEVRA